MQSHIRKVHAYLALTCHLYFWQNDRDLLRATRVTRGWTGYRNKSQHRKLTPEKKFSRRSCRDSNPRPFDHESSALTIELSPFPVLIRNITKMLFSSCLILAVFLLLLWLSFFLTSNSYIQFLFFFLFFFSFFFFFLSFSRWRHICGNVVVCFLCIRDLLSFGEYDFPRCLPLRLNCVCYGL